MPVICKTFEVYLREMIYHPERSKKWLNDKRLTTIEKTILKCHLLIRDNKNREAIKEIEKTPDSDIDFVNDQKNLLLGICHNNVSNFSLGEKYLNLAKAGFESKNEYYHLFTTLYSLMLVLANLGRIEEMGKVLARMEELRVDGLLPKIRLLRAQCVYATDSNNNEKARECIKEIKRIKSQMPESELGPQLIDEFIFYMKNEELANAESVLVEMKKYKKFSLTESFNLMKSLLSYLRNDTTIYVYERMFPNPASCQFYQMKVIAALQISDMEEATLYWNKLRKEHSEKLYQDDFKWTGEKCLFSLCLDKNRGKLTQTSGIKFIKSEGPKHLVIYDILTKAGRPVKAAELYEVLYGEALQDKDDLRKLARLIVSVRETYNVEVLSKKGTYQIVSKVEQAKKAVS